MVRQYSVVMPWRLMLWTLAVTVSTAAQPASSVSQMVALVRTSISSKQSDSQISKILRKVKLTERLDEHTVEELQSEGAGPKSTAELERLRETSAALPQPVSPPSFASPPIPSRG